ncbi:Dual specificity protein phosphatase [Wickerhamomyces ciferrii]|uniref:Dual specificity protein phosphatase n=1 Tax=Wickerhamomyces ciferrii (strain ATCC 14091 / BCRC 22168 / CBS 111 / JCM 3599 / NBRC 0793 / NRRL Y-1031 F-60-10) TaxID=1206466 RepID=K0KZQ9_WICCF|nr:Dual specificity protein phosphatase [Wickerhamomyces ciferrii]CCH46643.1 Dual specificity protein phosphatase [Wickerhamomyces ciferrii]
MKMLKEQLRRLSSSSSSTSKKSQRSKTSQDSSSIPRSLSLSTGNDNGNEAIKRPLLTAANSGAQYTYESHQRSVSSSSIEAYGSNQQIPTSYLNELRLNLPLVDSEIYGLTTPQLNKILDDWFTNPLPNVSTLFPYLHGAISQVQCEFLEMNPESISFIPKVRYLLIIKSNDVDNCCLIKSTVMMNDLTIEPLVTKDKSINLRNYSCQVSLLSKISDFIIYSEDNDMDSNLTLAKKLRDFQKTIGKSNDYNTYILDYNPKSLVAKYKINQDLSKLNSNMALQYTMNNWNMNYLFHERVELWLMTSKQQISKHLWLGNINDLHPENTHQDEFQLIINCHKHVNGFTDLDFDSLDELYDQCTGPQTRDVINGNFSFNEKHYIDFPSSGSFNLKNFGEFECEIILKYLKFINYSMIKMGKNCLIHCFDGYSSMSFLIIALEIYQTGESLSSILLKFFNDYKRPIYLFKNDIEIFQKVLEPFLRKNSPKNQSSSSSSSSSSSDSNSITSSIESMKLTDETEVSPSSITLSSLEDEELNTWLSNSIDKNLPSRIFPHLLLGTFEHASCPTLLSKLGISQIISFGAIPSWINDLDMETLHMEKFYANIDELGEEIKDESCVIYIYNYPSSTVKKLIHIPFLEDDGKCSITNYFQKIYQLIKQGYILPLNNELNLIHCRVGVSRSASFCILETMKLLNVSLPRAYLYVRVRRLNIIIQPNLKIFYELLKIEQNLNKEREIDWHVLCREIDYLNRRSF